MEALSALVQARIGQDDCVGALNALDREHPPSLTRKDRMGLSILKAQVLRSMGLPERAIGLLEEGLGSVSDPDQKAQVCFHLAQCHQGLGQWEPARRYFSQVLEVGEPGPLAQQAGLGLASMALKLGQPDQAIAFCRQVLDAHPAEPVRQRASDLLARPTQTVVSLTRRRRACCRSRPIAKGSPDTSRRSECTGPSGEVTRAKG